MIGYFCCILGRHAGWADIVVVGSGDFCCGFGLRERERDSCDVVRAGLLWFGGSTGR